MRPVTDLERRVAPFEVVSDYQPSGDQPAAIEEIVHRIKGGVQDVVLAPDLARHGFTVVETWYDDDGDLRGLAARR